MLPNLFMEGAHMGKIRLAKKIETEKKQKKVKKSCFTPHKQLIWMLAARSAGPATAATAATATAAATTATLGGQIWLGHPLHLWHWLEKKIRYQQQLYAPVQASLGGCQVERGPPKPVSCVQVWLQAQQEPEELYKALDFSFQRLKHIEKGKWCRLKALLTPLTVQSDFAHTAHAMYVHGEDFFNLLASIANDAGRKCAEMWSLPQ